MIVVAEMRIDAAVAAAAVVAVVVAAAAAAAAAVVVVVVVRAKDEWGERGFANRSTHQPCYSVRVHFAH